MNGMQSSSFIVGTAGHIDHGKSQLVAALTGHMMDRRPEETERGMTIDLGFTYADVGDRRFAFVDVPGHERFVANMLAGASGIQIALVCVAANEGPEPQTREHLAILHLLGIHFGIVALTKCDLADAELRQLAAAEVESVLHEYALDSFPIVPVSARSGEGIANLQQALVDVAAQVPMNAPEKSGPFRLPVDRVFTLPGHGRVVTGTVWQGTVSTGDTLESSGTADRLRVRRIDRHDQSVEQAAAGQRTALNIAGDGTDELHRGDELVTPKVFPVTDLLVAEVEMLTNPEHPVAHGGTVRLHTATQQLAARILLDRAELPPGQRALAVLKCERPLIATWGQRFLLRHPLPVGTFAGGRFVVVQPAGRKRTADLLRLGKALSHDVIPNRLAALIDAGDGRCPSATEALLEAGVPLEDFAQLLSRLQSEGRLFSYGSALITPQRKTTLQKQILDQVQAVHQSGKESWVPVASVTQRLARDYRADLVEGGIQELVSTGTLLKSGEQIYAAERFHNLPQKQRSLLRQLVQACDANRTPPTLAEFAANAQVERALMVPLAQLAVQSGQLIAISRELCATPQVLAELRRELEQLLSRQATATAAEIRDHWQFTRKHAIPYLEYFDAQGVTVRSGGDRQLAPSK